MTEAIRTEGLTKRYGETLALDGLDLSIGPPQLHRALGCAADPLQPSAFWQHNLRGNSFGTRRW